MIKIKYAKIKPVDIANGEGVRVSLFTSGCPHKCKGCFNSELWDYDAGEPFSFSVANRLISLASKSYISGISLLGGEPLIPENQPLLMYFVKAFKRYYPNKTVWCYTGYEWDEVKDLDMMRYIDVLVDGKFVQELADPRLRFRGSSNQRIIDVKKSLDSGQVFVRKDLME